MSIMRNVAGNLSISQHNKEARNNPWVIGWLIGLATVILINAIFIVIAFATSPGLVDEDYYETGRKYEENAIKMMEARNALQWQLQLNLPAEIRMGQDSDVHFTIVDVRGMPLRDAQVEIVSFRPSDADADFVTQMEEVAPGLFGATLNFPLKGVWDLNMTITRDGDTYDYSKRISVAAL
jgi:nitrogen fixation protein FixH